MGPDVFNFVPLNEAYADLETGQWAGPIEQPRDDGTTRFWFIHADQRVGGEAVRDLGRAGTSGARLIFCASLVCHLAHPFGPVRGFVEAERLSVR